MTKKQVSILILTAVLVGGAVIFIWFLTTEKPLVSPPSQPEPPIIIKSSEELIDILEEREKAGVTTIPPIIIDDSDLFDSKLFPFPAPDENSSGSPEGNNATKVMPVALEGNVEFIHAHLEDGSVSDAYFLRSRDGTNLLELYPTGNLAALIPGAHVFIRGFQVGKKVFLILPTIRLGF